MTKETINEAIAVLENLRDHGDLEEDIIIFIANAQADGLLVQGHVHATPLTLSNVLADLGKRYPMEMLMATIANKLEADQPTSDMKGLN